MKNIDKDIYQKILKEINEEKQLFKDNNLLYNPNSIWHGTSYKHGRFDRETLLKNQVEDMNDFLQFLFEESEHCDHISRREAYEQFEISERLKLLGE